MTGIRDFYRKRSDDLHIAGIAAVIVLIGYSVISLAIFNSFNMSYAVIYALTVFVLFFIFKRLLSYTRKTKEGVIEKHK